MEERLDRDEVAILIQGRTILKAKGLSKDVDVKRICEAAGVSRKTGYQWAGKLEKRSDDGKNDQREDATRQSHLSRWKGQCPQQTTLVM